MTTVMRKMKTRLKSSVRGGALSPEATFRLPMSFLRCHRDPDLTCHDRSLGMKLVTLSWAPRSLDEVCRPARVRARLGGERRQTKSPGLTEIIPSELFHYVPSETERLNLLLTRGFIGSHIALGEASRRST